MEVRLRDLLLDLEDRIHQGSLGTLKVGSAGPSDECCGAPDGRHTQPSHFPVFKVMDRKVWRTALEEGNYELLGFDAKENGVMNGQAEPWEVDSAHLRTRERCNDR